MSISALLTLGKITVPLGLTAGSFEVTLQRLDAGTPVDVERREVADPAAPVVFDVTAPGKYIVQAVRLSTEGDRLSTPVVSDSVSILAEADAPVAVAITLA